MQHSFIHLYSLSFSYYESSLQIAIVTFWRNPKLLKSQFENVSHKLVNHSYHITSTLKSCVVPMQHSLLSANGVNMCSSCRLLRLQEVLPGMRPGQQDPRRHQGCLQNHWPGQQRLHWGGRAEVRHSRNSHLKLTLDAEASVAKNIHQIGYYCVG